MDRANSQWPLTRRCRHYRLCHRRPRDRRPLSEFRHRRHRRPPNPLRRRRPHMPPVLLRSPGRHRRRPHRRRRPPPKIPMVILMWSILVDRPFSKRDGSINRSPFQFWARLFVAICGSSGTNWEWDGSSQGGSRGGWRNWKTRWFVLNKDGVSYYDSDKAYQKSNTRDSAGRRQGKDRSMSGDAG